MPQVVVDTNILVRAILKPTSSDGKIFRLLFDRKITLYYSKNLLSELVRVLNYPRIQKKYHLSDDAQEIFIKTIAVFGRPVNPTEKVTICRDTDDNELLSIALEVYHNNPVYLITADDDLLVLKDKIKGIAIVTPREYLKIKEN